jgi:hypothetical protein
MLPTISRKQDNSRAHMITLLNYLSPGNENFCCVHVCVSVCVFVCVFLCVSESVIRVVNNHRASS